MTREDMVAFHLQNYLKGCRELARLEDILQNYPAETLNETILSLNHVGADCEERVQTSFLSDPTYRVATRFRFVNERHNREGKDELAREIEEIRSGLRLVKECVERLSGRPRQILQMLYVDGMSWDEVEVAEQISRTTLQYHRKRGIADIARMTPYILWQAPPNLAVQ